MHGDHEDPPQNKHASDHQKELRSPAANPTLKRKSQDGQLSMFYSYFEISGFVFIFNLLFVDQGWDLLNER